MLGDFRYAWCTPNLMARTLGRMGHDIIRIQEDEAGLFDVVNKANSSDLFFWSMTYGMLGLDGSKMLSLIKVPTFTYHLDVLVGIEREDMIKENPFFKLDYFFQTDGDPETLKRYKDLGVNAFWLPAACSKEECYLAPKVKDFQHDIIFVGSYKYHKEHQYRGMLINWLRSVYNKRFCLYPDDRNMFMKGHELNQLYATAKVVIGDSFGATPPRKNYWSNRVPETTGRGGFLIHRKVEGMEKFYADGKDLVTYDNGDFSQLRDYIDYYLYHDAEREKIKRSGMQYTKENQTFDNRIEEMFKIMGVINE